MIGVDAIGWGQTVYDFLHQSLGSQVVRFRVGALDQAHLDGIHARQQASGNFGSCARR
jgi:hypothetical protein